MNTLKIAEAHERVYEGMKEARAPVMRALEATIRDMFSEMIGDAQKVLEVGAGDGFLKRTLKPTYDWTEFDMYYAKSRKDRSGFVQGDATKMPFADGTFDAVVGFESYNSFKYANLEKSVRESIRVLKPNGNLLVFHDLGINTDITMELLGDCPKEIRDFTFGKLSFSGIEVVPPEHVARYKKLSEKFEKIMKEKGMCEEAAELHCQFRPLFQWLEPEKQVDLFHKYLTGIITDSFEEVNTGATYEDHDLPILKGQKEINLHADNLSRAEFKKKYGEFKKGPVAPGFAREIVVIPYVLGKGKL